MLSSRSWQFSESNPGSLYHYFVNPHHQSHRYNVVINTHFNVTSPISHKIKQTPRNNVFLISMNLQQTIFIETSLNLHSAEQKNKQKTQPAHRVEPAFRLSGLAQPIKFFARQQSEPGRSNCHLSTVWQLTQDEIGSDFRLHCSVGQFGWNCVAQDD